MNNNSNNKSSYVSFLELKLAHLYKVKDIKNKSVYKVFIVQSIVHYEDGKVVEFYHPYSPKQGYTDYYCFDVDNEKFVYLTELSNNFLDLRIQEIGFELLKPDMRKKLFEMQREANSLHSLQMQINSELELLYKQYCERYDRVLRRYNNVYYSDLIEDSKKFAISLMNEKSKEDILSEKEFERYLSNCLSSDVKNVLNSPHRYTISFSLESSGDETEYAVYRLAISRDIKLNKNVNSLRCIDNSDKSSMHFNRKHPEYLTILRKERVGENPLLWNICFNKLPFSDGGGYAPKSVMDFLYVVDYRNPFYRHRKKIQTEGVYYHRDLVFQDYKPFKLTKENAELIANSIYFRESNETQQGQIKKKV